MNAQILKLIFKKYWDNQQLALLEWTIVNEWYENATQQEKDYFTKLATINF